MTTNTVEIADTYSLPSKEFCPPPNAKRSKMDVEADDDKRIDAIVNVLGEMLIEVKQSILEKTESYTPSAAVTFVLRRMDVNTHDLLSDEIYSLMTGFMTVYLCFIQLVLQQDFHHFMKLFSKHDSFLTTEDNQPFLWYYTLHNDALIPLLHQKLHQKIQLLTSDFVLTRIDSIFSKFYTLHFLETSARQHQKDHGQFYTPQSVIDFMWNRCASLPRLIEYLLLNNNDNNSNSPLYIPRIFDPCLGIGSFVCEYLTRIIKACQFTSAWNDPYRLSLLLTQQIPSAIWGIEIDPFAFQLSKMNLMVHFFPLYQRLKELRVQLAPASIERLRLFCNDTLKLKLESNPFWMTADRQLALSENNNSGGTVAKEDSFEQSSLASLRDSSSLKFDFIVTNPPYMIRKTGFIAQPDPELYDESRLGGRGTQAYLYFIWIALQRCDDTRGQICMITPSQWTVLEFARNLREWMWEHCRLLDMYELEPYKVWPKVQTDSLIFRVCKRSNILPFTDHTLYLRHMSRKISLMGLLQQYENFNPSCPVPGILYKYTPHSSYQHTHYSFVPTSASSSNPSLFSKNISFAFMMPSASCLEELERITRHLPRLCDEEPKKVSVSSRDNNIPPLVWNRGPNTNPVYSLVVRTSWAKQIFGLETCNRWLKPCFYWNGKSILSATGGGKEGEFWKTRDPLRLIKKETSAAEAYWPYCMLDTDKPAEPFYSLIMVNKDDAAILKAEYEQFGREKSSIAPLYHYLQDARVALQPNQTDKDIAHCQYNKCGIDVPTKIIHPINCGYFTRSQPRSRFFVDKTKAAVTNQCIYFTIKANSIWQDPDFFCALLNSTLIQFFLKIHCCYDQQGRMRFFGRSMAAIPFAPPPLSATGIVHYMALFAQGITAARTWIYTLVRHTTPTSFQTRLMERVRNYEWRQLTPEERQMVRNQFRPPGDYWLVQPDVSLSTFSYPPPLNWIYMFAVQYIYQNCNGYNGGDNNGYDLDIAFVTLIKVTSLFQYALDQLTYYLYQIPEFLQYEIEKELKLTNLRKDWRDEGHRQQYSILQQDLRIVNDIDGWCKGVMDLGISFTQNKE
ncbi:S-adenosyl-L-methionine-dependent methyltransferase [Mycotypha africana]|uniref:S-adenosyl-L-methionine-dependent methyltransferase n=1 Tax=Mycotypha africana TaxID=64632 RepID=UPI002300EA91|nr:S-adenosyl-L-methionine-dependent methyltransferase [Mycotypha africana]KAI8988547.1 S-adenosyl-L-methionine-dependent methyltransferase [Mycotypha africana]